MNKLITFFKIENGILQRGSGYSLPNGFTEYTVGNEPKELMDAIQAETDAKAKSIREAEIHARLNEIDIQSLRPLRSIQQHNETEQDMQKLNALEAEAEQLRAELAGL